LAAQRTLGWVHQLTGAARRHVLATVRLAEQSSSLATHLARLRILAALRSCVDEQIEDEVHAAGAAGASYTQIARVMDMSRQNARRRWPNAVTRGPGPRPRPRTRPSVTP